MSKFVLFCERCRVGFTLVEGDEVKALSMSDMEDIIHMHRYESHRIQEVDKK